MREAILNKDYAKAFKRVVILAVLLALCSAVVLPLRFSGQFRAWRAQEQITQEQTVQQDAETRSHGDQALRARENRKQAWKAQLAALSAGDYAILGGLSGLWLVLLVYYWLLVVAWLYRSAVNEGMNKSLWPILGLFTNLLAVFAFLIVRDRPKRSKPQVAQ